MAEIDFRVASDFADHIKTKKLAAIASDTSIVCLLRLWGFARRNHPSGMLDGMTLDDIELAAGWNGKKRMFVDALRTVRMLDREKGVFTLHDWNEHQPWACDMEWRHERAVKAAKTRWNNHRSNATSNPRSNPKTSNKQCTAHTPCNASSNARTEPNRTSSNPPSPPSNGGKGASPGRTFPKATRAERKAAEARSKAAYEAKRNAPVPDPFAAVRSVPVPEGWVTWASVFWREAVSDVSMLESLVPLWERGIRPKGEYGYRYQVCYGHPDPFVVKWLRDNATNAVSDRLTDRVGRPITIVVQQQEGNGETSATTGH